MSEAKKLVGKTMTHTDLGEVYVKEVLEGSRTKVVVEILERGKGYNSIKDKFTGTSRSGKDHKGNRFVNWSRGENRSFGELDNVHINTLS